MNKQQGFTLVELLIYVAIFAIVAVALSSILVTFTRVNIGQVGKNEVASQLNFAMQTMQRLINNAGLMVVRSETDGIDDETDSALGQPLKYLVIKDVEEINVPDDANSPIVIYRDAVDSKIKIRQGRGSLVTIEDLTTDAVLVDGLSFTKYVNYPGQDVVEINLTMSYNSDHPQQQITRSLILGVGKAVAAVFDTSLLPGADNSADVGQGTKRWRDGYFSGDINIDGNASLATTNVGDGTPINGLYTGFLSVDPPLITGYSNGSVTISAPASIGASDRIFLTPPQDLNSGLLFVGARTVDATDQIEITIRNVTAGNIKGDAKNWAYLLVK
ncbi:MAG: type II secretion system protein [Patescibacteria group bacterium]